MSRRKVPSGAGALEFLQGCVALMPKGKRISYFRSDSAAYQAGVMNYCFHDNIWFTISADQDEVVKKAIKAIKEDTHPMDVTCLGQPKN